ncbi:MAG TPA: efflux RND transporter periplasmic adaptor subunit [Kofleriaceae bacterium]|nr:efflux RND transporter periplasmic adaptor subunit [Kofleriaceae bacterium]
MRDLAELAGLLQGSMPSVDHARVEAVAIKLAELQLLSNVTPDMQMIPMAPIIPLHPVPSPPPEDEFDEEPTSLTSGKKLDSLFAAAAEVDESPFDDGTDIVPPTFLDDEQVISSATREAPARAPTPPSAPVAEAPAPAPPPPPPAEPAPTPAPAAAADPKQPAWEEEQPPWYKRKKVRRRLVLLGVLLVLVALALIPYPLYVTVPCKVSPIDRAEVRSQISGIIAEVYVREGDRVEIGTPLVRLDDIELTHQLRQAQAEAERYRANLAKIQAGSRPEEVKRAQALVSARAQDVKYADIEARRQQKLFNDGVTSAAARDEARRDLEVKRSALAEAQAELRLVQAGSRSEEVTIAEAELRKVEAEIEYLKKQMDGLLVRSPIVGRVLTPRIHERLHENLKPGDTVAEVGNEDSVRVDIFVPESDADVVQVGHPVAVKVKSYPLESFHGRVSLIAPAVEEIDNERVIRVETIIENDTGLLRPRMTGYAEIDTGERPLAVRVFRRAVRWLRVRFLL